MAIAGLPYRGWYNGNIELMMENGTYADFRHMFVRSVELQKMEQAILAEYDKRWEKIPVEERLARRNLVVENGTPKEVIIQTHDGPLVKVVTVPDENDNRYKERQKEKVKKARKLPAGALTSENNPIVNEAKPVAPNTPSSLTPSTK
jgi:hypothetical protein